MQLRMFVGVCDSSEVCVTALALRIPGIYDWEAGEQTVIFPSPGIETKALDYPVRSLVTTSAELSLPQQ